MPLPFPECPGSAYLKLPDTPQHLLVLLRLHLKSLKGGKGVGSWGLSGKGVGSWGGGRAG